MNFLLVVRSVNENLNIFLGVGLVEDVCIPWWEREEQRLGFWVLSWGSLMGMKLKREEMPKWVERVTVCSPRMEFGRIKGGKPS